MSVRQSASRMVRVIVGPAFKLSGLPAEIGKLVNVFTMEFIGGHGGLDLVARLAGLVA